MIKVRKSFGTSKGTGIMRNRKRKIWVMIWSLCLFLLLGCGEINSRQLSQEKTSTKVTEGNLEVHFIDVGQGDATLIRQGEHAMLIDAGDNSKGTAVQAYLQSQNIQSLDYVIGTHPDSDHIGGLDVVLYKFEWDTVMMPDLEKDTRTYEDVKKVIQDKNQRITVPKPGDTYTLGEAEFTIVCPQKADYGDNSNDYSIGLRLTYGENHFLFTGDAEEASEQDMLVSGMDLSADIFKVAHHGSDTANTEEFLKTVNPKYVVISCGEGNSYGHPRAAVLNELRQMGAEVYRTDEQGTIVAYSDGKNITWNCSPSDTWNAGEPTGSSEEGKPQETQDLENTQALEETQEQESENATYVINANTKKFHKPSCNSVEQMSEENRQYTVESREKLIEDGYEPCKRCQP